MTQRQTAVQKLDALGIDAICEAIANNTSQKKLSEKLGVDPAVLSKWLSADNQRSARAESARQASADTWEQRGEDELIAISDNATKAAVQRQIALAQHCYRMARICHPQKHGDKITHSGDAENPIAILTGEQLDARIAALQSKITS